MGAGMLCKAEACARLRLQGAREPLNHQTPQRSHAHRPSHHKRSDPRAAALPDARCTLNVHGEGGTAQQGAEDDSHTIHAVTEQLHGSITPTAAGVCGCVRCGAAAWLVCWEAGPPRHHPTPPNDHAARPARGLNDLGESMLQHLDAFRATAPTRPPPPPHAVGTSFIPKVPS